MNDIERYNFWNTELETVVRKEKLKIIAEKLKGRELFPEQIKRAKEFLKNSNIEEVLTSKN